MLPLLVCAALASGALNPADVPSLKLGSKVEIRQGDVLDYAIKQRDEVLEKSY